jgi:alpha,alpha-trehalase
MYTNGMPVDLDKKKYIQLSGELFERVQKEKLFTDSKTFVDATPKFTKEEIEKKFNLEKMNPTFDLAHFVEENFDLPKNDEGKIVDSTEHKNYRDALHTIWDTLYREGESEQKPGSTLISLDKPYIVPGGRFREMYYWDTFFTVLGLYQSNKISLIESICDNFVQLIDTLGHIPNGNRIYFASRSQPPVFALIVNMLVRKVDARYIKKYIGACEKEYRYWMEGYNMFDGKLREHKHLIDLDENEVLNRYFDNEPIPREEAYTEETAIAENLPDETKPEFYRNMRSAAESGWDFSSRWLKDGKTLTSINTSEIIPVDLNCLLYLYEQILSDWYGKLGSNDVSQLYRKLGEKRKELIQKYCYNHDKQFFCDYSWKRREHTNVLSLASVFALFAKIATPEQAQMIAHHLEEDFLYPGGLVTTLNETGQQWDFPNGWAPLQWIAIRGLQNYGLGMIAEEIKSRWTDNCIRVYNETGHFFEKYNVVHLRQQAEDGEYPTQTGFGWTNGVLLDLLAG